MNIKEAKEQIKHTMQVYFSKDEFGNYCLNTEYQRPVFLMGPPGIGKTAIMQQIAEELGVGLVSYSMTHHTRQSALGLPFIVEKDFGGITCHVAEYTMSEIVASVYNKIEKTGLKEGILFLDEINCVSETLAPAMLQFLQYKTFGTHQIPKGWIVVTAGNPPEYNKSVRDFDIVTWDRLKRMDVEPDFEVWKDYAIEREVHPAIRAYLELHPEDFYRIETTIDGKQFVTARGWEDLSKMIVLYEKNQITVDPELFGQYIQFKKVAEEFGMFFELYQKYRSDYQLDRILEGTESPVIRSRAKGAPFDEKVMLVNMLLDIVTGQMRQVMLKEKWMLLLRDELKRAKSMSGNLIQVLEQRLEKEKAALELEQLRGTISREKEYITRCFVRELGALILDGKKLPADAAQGEVFDCFRQSFSRHAESLRMQAEQTGAHLSHLFGFVDQVFGNGQEMLLLLTELTKNRYATRFLGRYASEEYGRFSEKLMIQERQNQILEQLILELE